MKCRTSGNRDDETARRQPAGRQRIRKNARIGVSDFIVVVFQKRTPAAYGARHHARPCDRLKNNSPQTAGDAFGTDPTVGHRTKLIINYGKNDLPTRKKCGVPRRQPHPHPASPDNPIIASRLRLPPVRTRSPAFSFRGRAVTGRHLPDGSNRNAGPAAATGHDKRGAGPDTAAIGRQQPSGDSGHYRPSTSQKRAGRWIFSTSRARAKSGAICAGVKPAMPQPISVTRKVISGCCRANRMKSST